MNSCRATPLHVLCTFTSPSSSNPKCLRVTWHGAQGSPRPLSSRLLSCLRVSSRTTLSFAFIRINRLHQGAMTRHPEIVWAQCSDKVYVTVELPDAKNPKVKLEPEGKFIFSASAGPENYLYEVELDLYKNVDVESSKISIGPRHIFVVIQKGEKKWWKRLLSFEGKSPPYIKVDWNKWVDEDEEDSSKFDKFDLGGMNDFSKFSAEDEADDDDEEFAESESELQSKPVEGSEISA